MGQTWSCRIQVEDASKVVGYIPKRRRSYQDMKGGLVLLKSGPTSFEAEYGLGKMIGSDEAVWMATSRETEIAYALRRVQKADMPFKHQTGIISHLENLKGLQHVHICAFVEAFDYEHHLDLVYEMANARSLFDDVTSLREGKPLKEEVVRAYAQQMSMALAVAHRSGIFHGRLCETSILYDPYELENDAVKSIKICDMGQTFMFRSARFSGKIAFTAPEVLSEELGLDSPTSPRDADSRRFMNRRGTDMWALGIIIFTMLTGTNPFKAKIEKDLVHTITSTSVDFEPNRKIWAKAPLAKDAVRILLLHSTRMRCTAEKFLKHPWIIKDPERVSRSKMTRVMQNVVAFSNETTFKKFVMRVIAEDMPPEKVQIIQAAFCSIDKNGDGMLDCEEIRKAINKYLDILLPVADVLNALDRDCSGSIGFPEFMAASLGQHECCNKEVLWNAFNRFDKDGDGRFDKMEISSVVRELDNLSQHTEVNAEVEEISKDVSMPMDFDAFFYTMCTPAGQTIDHTKKAMSGCLWKSFGVDPYEVRHIEPKAYNQHSSRISDLYRSPWKSTSSRQSTKGYFSPQSCKGSARSDKASSQVSDILKCSEDKAKGKASLRRLKGFRHQAFTEMSHQLTY